MQPEKTIVIYADFLEDFLWEKNASDMSSFIGIDSAGTDRPPSTIYGTSSSLDEDFFEWYLRFCTDCDTTLDWDQFHRDGIELAKRLKAAVGDRYEVEYHPPLEDRVREGMPLTRIRSDGTLHAWVPVKQSRTP